MKQFLFLAFMTAASFASANLIDTSSRIYAGDLFHNEKPFGVCYVQINNVEANATKGKHCTNLKVQMMFGLEDLGVHSREMELLLTSRKTNNEADFHKPTTCAEVMGDVAYPWEIDKWGDDTTHLFNQVFNAAYKVNKKTNHYTLTFNGITRKPSRAMIYRASWFRED